jgi:hypothetical protein
MDENLIKYFLKESSEYADENKKYSHCMKEIKKRLYAIQENLSSGSTPDLIYFRFGLRKYKD